MTVSDVRRKTAERMADETQDMLPCRYCGTATTRAMLSVLGARCQTCYAEYLRVGYSGASPPPQFARSPAVAADAEKCRAHRSGMPNHFAGLAAAIEAKRREVSIPSGLSDDDMNSLLQAEGTR